MRDTPSNLHQIAIRNKFPLSVVPIGAHDTLAQWAEMYLHFEVTTAPSSRLVQRRDIGLFAIGARNAPRRAGYRPWRNRAIVYLLIETGMRRAAVTSLDLADVDFRERQVSVTEKEGVRHTYQISREGLAALEGYIEEERGQDAEVWASPALFLASGRNAQGAGRITPQTVNLIWREVCRVAVVEGRTPHSARHAMGKHIIEKTGNVAAVQRQLGHKNAAYSLQYARISDAELSAVIDERP